MLNILPSFTEQIQQQCHQPPPPMLFLEQMRGEDAPVRAGASRRRPRGRRPEVPHPNACRCVGISQRVQMTCKTMQMTPSAARRHPFPAVSFASTGAQRCLRLNVHTLVYVGERVYSVLTNCSGCSLRARRRRANLPLVRPSTLPTPPSPPEDNLAAA